jgi:hypothetical protein
LTIGSGVVGHRYFRERIWIEDHHYKAALGILGSD